MRQATRTHKFQLGQTLRFLQQRMLAPDGAKTCKVLQLLPPQDGEPQYRIKCTSESTERVAKELALSRCQ